MTAAAGSLDDLLALGAKTVPVVALGESWVPGVRLDLVGQLVGIEHDDTPILDPPTLAARLHLVLEATLSLAEQIPPDRLGDSLPHRDRSYLGLVNHVIQIGVGFVEVAEGAPLDEQRAAAVPLVELDLAALRVQASDVRRRITNWIATTDDPGAKRSVETFVGQLDLHRVLERTTWHCAQHARQLTMVLSMLDIAPNEPLDDAVYQDLPMPAAVWDG